MKGWVKLNLKYYGRSKKHEIFRAMKWNTTDERIFRKTVYNEKYEQIGYIKDIFGPAKLPFVSIKTSSEQEIDPLSSLYVKM